LSEGLCAIQKTLGEERLSIMCATFPRVMNIVDDVLQRSLHLSCPEAARLVLLDPNPMEFDEAEDTQQPRLGQLPVLSVSNDKSGKPYRYFREISSLIIWLLQQRAYPLPERLVIIGSLCDQLDEMAGTADGYSRTIEVLEAYRDAADRDLFRDALNNHDPQPVAQLEMVLELIVGRIGSDFTPPRFLACYREFIQGMAWTAESSMDDLGRRYLSIFSRHYAPFMRENEYMLEHYLVTYVHGTLFPLGPQESNRELSAHHTAKTIRAQCLLMMTYYSIIQTILIGLAGFHESEFGAGQVIQLIQSFSKTFEHSVTFPERALQVIAHHGVKTCAGLAMLVRN